MELSLNDFLRLRNLGLMHLVSVGSERGYISRSSYPRGRYCGIVKCGFRAGLHKYQPCGFGGPHGNSSVYCTNLYYRYIPEF